MTTASRRPTPCGPRFAIDEGDVVPQGIGYGHRGLTFSSESKAGWFDPVPGHHILGVHSEDPAGFVMIQPRRLSVIGTSVTPRHI